VLHNPKQPDLAIRLRICSSCRDGFLDGHPVLTPQNLTEQRG
jgi:hypothetical protein